MTGNYNESFAQYKFANAQTRSLTKGMIVRVQAGYRCPCDGVVVYGSTEVDERYISGRRMMSAVKNMGDVIYAGTRVLYSDLYVCCVMINQDTIIGRIFSFCSALRRRVITSRSYIESQIEFWTLWGHWFLVSAYFFS